MVIYTCISGRRIKFWGLYEGYYEIYSFSLLNRQYQVHIFINKKIVTLRMSVFLPNYLLPYAKVVMRVGSMRAALIQTQEADSEVSHTTKAQFLFWCLGHCLHCSNCQTSTHKPKLVAQSLYESKACTSLLQAKTLAHNSVFSTGLASGPAQASWARARQNSQPEVALLTTL